MTSAGKSKPSPIVSTHSAGGGGGDCSDMHGVTCGQVAGEMAGVCRNRGAVIGVAGVPRALRSAWAPGVHGGLSTAGGVVAAPAVKVTDTEPDVCKARTRSLQLGKRSSGFLDRARRIGARSHGGSASRCGSAVRCCIMSWR